MANAYLDTTLVDRAIKFAVDAHANTERRGKGFPYVVHVLEAMEIVATMTSDPELLCAAVLHDTVEDTDVTLESIRNEFGERVAALVEAETDRTMPSRSESESWRDRKQAAIDRIASSSFDAKMVALGDKLSNMRAIRRDYLREGDRLWNLFHAPNGKADHEWHYRGLAASLSPLSDTDAYREFAGAIDDVFGHREADRIDIGEYEESGRGFTATSYNSRDGLKMVKMYSEDVPSAVPANELKVTEALVRMGLDVPKAFRTVTDGRRTGVEFARLPGKKSFARAIADDWDNMESYTRQFAQLCRRLHATECDTAVFPPAGKRFLDVVRLSSLITPSQKERVAAFISGVPEMHTCVHGDLHIGNALISGTKHYWIDLGDFSYGNPLFDLGMFRFVSGVDFGDGFIEDMFHISGAQLRDVWGVFEREYFGPEADLEEEERKLEPFAGLYSLMFCSRGVVLPGMKEYYETKLLARI